MRQFVWMPFVVISLVIAPTAVAGELKAVTDGAQKPLEIRITVPPMEAAGLSMLAPGAGQLYLGDSLKASAYLGGSAALGIGSYFMIRQLVWPEAFIPPESNALIILNAVGIAWLTGGLASTWDAYQTLQAQQPPFEAIEPSGDLK